MSGIIRIKKDAKYFVAGYMLRVREKPEGNRGRFEWVTEIYESKQLNPTIGLLCTDGQRTDAQPTSGQRTDAEKPHIVSTELANTEPIKTERGNTEGGTPPPTAALSALDIYKSVTKIKKADKIPEAVVDWLNEQDQ